MANIVISEEIQRTLIDFLQANPKTELVTAYLFFVEEKFDVSPVAIPREKMIFRSLEEATHILGNSNRLWRETQIKIGVGTEAVNELTTKIYICPFTGKVYGDNTHPNPQDAIYDWVSKCPENAERVDGLRVKRFFVSEDPDVIKSYISKKKKTLTKTVYSSAISGKLFHSKAAVIEDFKQNQIKPMTLLEVQNQNRFEIEPMFLEFLQRQLNEDRITAFVEAMAELDRFISYVENWVDMSGEAEEEAEVLDVSDSAE